MNKPLMYMIAAGLMAAAGLAGCGRNEASPGAATAKAEAAQTAQPDTAPKPADPNKAKPIPVRIGNETINIQAGLTQADILASIGPNLASRGTLKQTITWTATSENDPLRSIEFTFHPNGRLESAEWRFKPAQNDVEWPECENALKWLEEATGTERMDHLVMDRTSGLSSYTFAYDVFNIDVGGDPKSSWISIYPMGDD